MKQRSLSISIGALLLTVGSALQVQAQQLPLRSNWQFNYFQENPAFAGFTDCLELKAGFRQQWAGFDGAPQTAFANVQGELGRTAGGGVHGFGGRVTDDSAGPYGFTQLDLAYAYHMKMAQGWRLAAGAAVGFMQYRLSLGDIVLPDFQAGNDPAITSNANQLLAPTMDFGVWAYNKYTFWGLSIQNLIEPSVDQWGLEHAVPAPCEPDGGVHDPIGRTMELPPSGLDSLCGGGAGGGRCAGDVRLRRVRPVSDLGYRNETALAAMMTLNVNGEPDHWLCLRLERWTLESSIRQHARNHHWGAGLPHQIWTRPMCCIPVISPQPKLDLAV